MAAASCTAPVPQLKREVHGPPQLLVFWRRLSRKQSLFRCSIPCPSQSSRGVPVSFSFSQAYPHLLLTLPSSSIPHSPASFSLLGHGLQRRFCHPLHPCSAARGSEGQGTLVWLVKGDLQVCASAKPQLNMAQPALSIWGSHFQLMSMAFPAL